MIKLMPNEDALNKHWYIQVKNRESGPYSYLEVLSMIHNEDIEGSNGITYRGLGDWHPISEFENFKKEHVASALEENNIDPEEDNDVPFRRSIRIPVSCEVLTIVDDFVFTSECIDLSTGGCLIKIPRGKIKANSKIRIHFYGNDHINLAAFNINGESVRNISAAHLKEGTSYFDLIGVQFQNVKKENRDALRSKIKEIVLTTLSDVAIERVLRRNQVLAAA